MAAITEDCREALTSARDRCWEVARSERLWGYPDNARTYDEMAGEVQAALWWLAREPEHATV